MQLSSSLTLTSDRELVVGDVVAVAVAVAVVAVAVAAVAVAVAVAAVVVVVAVVVVNTVIFWSRVQLWWQAAVLLFNFLSLPAFAW